MYVGYFPFLYFIFTSLEFSSPNIIWTVTYIMYAKSMRVIAHHIDVQWFHVQFNTIKYGKREASNPYTPIHFTVRLLKSSSSVMVFRAHLCIHSVYLCIFAICSEFNANRCSPSSVFTSLILNTVR